MKESLSVQFMHEFSLLLARDQTMLVRWDNFRPFIKSLNTPLTISYLSHCKEPFLSLSQHLLDPPQEVLGIYLLHSVPKHQVLPVPSGRFAATP